MHRHTLACAWQQLRVWGLYGFRLMPGLLVIGLAMSAPALRRNDGWLMPQAWAVAVGGIVLSLLGATWQSRWQRCMGLLALALVGQACALLLLYSPPWGVYQRYLPWSAILTSLQGLPLIGVLGQTMVTIWAVPTIWPGLKKHVLRLLTIPQALLFLGFLIFSGVLLTDRILQYGVEVVLTAWIYGISTLNLILVAAAIPNETLEAIHRWLQAALTGRLDRLLPWLVAGWVTVVTGVITWVVFERVPHIPDSASYLFQAKYFSTGRLYLPAPPDAASFTVGQVVNDGAKWYGYGFPGWPAILALGVLAGVPWLVNPLLGGMTVLLTHALLCRLYSRSLAHGVVLLMAASPWFLFMSASFMAHPVTLLWGLLAMLAVERARGSGRGRWGVVAGICLGALFLTRPLEGILIGSVVGLWALGIGGRRLTARAVAGLVTASLLVGAWVFVYNYALTGRATYAAHMKWTDENWYPGADRLGFGPDIGNVGWTHLDPLPGHGPVDVLINAHKNVYMANFELFGWGFGSLSVVVLALLLSGIRRTDWLFLAVILAIALGHSFYWFSGGPDLGARYWYQSLVPLVVLTVRGVQIIQHRLIEAGAMKLTAWRVTAVAVIASLVAVVNVMPWRSLGKYHRYRGMSADIGRLAQAHGFNHDLVFVQSRDADDYASYTSAFIFNPPTLEAPGPIYARDLGPTHRETVRRHFPERPVWLVGYSAIEKDYLRVLAHPFSTKAAAGHDAESSSQALSLVGP